MYVDNIVLMANSGMELQIMLEVVQAYVMRWDEVQLQEEQDYGNWEREDRTSLKIVEEIMDEVEEFKNLGCGLRGN